VRPEKAATMLRDRGLTCSDLGVVALGRAGASRTAHVLAAVATATGARTCVAALPAPLARSDALSALDECAAVLADAGVRLALEVASYGGLTRLADAVRLCEEVGWERCGLLVDSWHFVRTGADWQALGALAGGEVALVHLSDGNAEPGDDPVRDGRYGRIPPGAGSFPLQTFAAALDSCGYSGFLSLEVLSDSIRLLPPDEGARLLRNKFELTLG
jgi:sugar phosphate isomerase/epimerase